MRTIVRLALAGTSMVALGSAALAQDVRPADNSGIQGAGTPGAGDALPPPPVAPGAQAPSADAQGATVSTTTAGRANQTDVGAPTAIGGDIIVTATRRAERLQDVPLAVNALSGQQLVKSGYQTVQDIQYQIPGVQFGTSPNDAGFRLRGVGTAGGFSSSSEQNVGTVVDNVVIPFGNPVQSLGDLDRIEVLKGPQGTQFGKNASSGVVNITTRKPDLTRFGASATATYGELNDYNVNASVNVPLAPTLAVAAYGFTRGYDGFVDNVVRDEKWGGVKAYGGRAKLLWQPTDDFSAYLIGDWSQSRQKGPGQLWTLNRAPALTDPLTAVRFAAVAALGVTPSFKNDKSVEDGAGGTKERNYGGSLELNYKLGEYNLTSITAYRRLDLRPFVYSIDALPFPIFTAQESGADRNFVSEEIRLTSPRGQFFEYVAGLYASRQKAGIGGQYASAQLRPAVPFDPVQISITNGRSTTKTRTDSVAAFFDGRARISDQFSFLLGGRYSYDWVKASSFSVVDPNYPPFVGPNGFTVPYGPRPFDSGKTKKGDYSGRVGFEVKPARDVLFFGTVARGYLGPTVTFSGLTGTRTNVDPQTVVDVTVGAKTQLFDRHLTLNGNVFYDHYKNLQTSVFNGLEFVTQNAGAFEAVGFEIETAYRFSQRLSVNAAYTYSDTVFLDYVTACPNSILAAGAAATSCTAPGSTAATPLFQARGKPLAGAPKHTVNAGINYNQPIGERLLVDASATYYYRSEVFYDVGNDFSRQRGYDIVGLNVGIGAPNGQWRVGVFARNLFDKRFVSSVIGLPFANPGGEVNWETRDGRRTIGGQASIRF